MVLVNVAVVMVMSAATGVSGDGCDCCGGYYGSNCGE